MEQIETTWLEQQIREWESKGWVSHEGAVQIRHILEMNTGGIPLPLLIIVMAMGLAIVGMALIWELSDCYFFHKSPSAPGCSAASRGRGPVKPLLSPIS